MTPEETVQFTLNKFGFEEVTKPMDEESTFRAINRLEKRVSNLEHQQQPKPNGRAKWSDFETTILLEDIRKVISHRSFEFGRSRNSLVWKMWHLLGVERELPQEP
jgi:hypothetical protein